MKILVLTIKITLILPEGLKLLLKKGIEKDFDLSIDFLLKYS
jgi:hypothetical protein